MSNIWTDQNRYEAWLEVEILACEAWSKLGDIPEEDVKKIRQNAKVNVERAQEIEQETRHDSKLHMLEFPLLTMLHSGFGQSKYLTFLLLNNVQSLK